MKLSSIKRQRIHHRFDTGINVARSHIGCDKLPLLMWLLVVTPLAFDVRKILLCILVLLLVSSFITATDDRFLNALNRWVEGRAFQVDGGGLSAFWVALGEFSVRSSGGGGSVEFLGAWEFLDVANEFRWFPVPWKGDPIKMTRTLGIRDSVDQTISPRNRTELRSKQLSRHKRSVNNTVRLSNCRIGFQLETRWTKWPSPSSAESPRNSNKIHFV